MIKDRLDKLKEFKVSFCYDSQSVSCYSGKRDKMTKKELVKALEKVPDDTIIICKDGGIAWTDDYIGDYIQCVLYHSGGTCSIVFGDGQTSMFVDPFSDKKGWNNGINKRK